MIYVTAVVAVCLFVSFVRRADPPRMVLGASRFHFRRGY